MHAGAEQAQAALAAEGIVAGQQDRALRTEAADEQAGEHLTEVVERPSIVGEEAVETGPVADADLAGGEDTLGDEAVATGQGPARKDQGEQAKRGGGEDAAEVL